MVDAYIYQDKFCQSELQELYSGKYSDCEGHVLEVGAGPGNWTEHLLKKAITLEIIEKNREFCCLLEDKFKQDVKVYCCTLDDFEPKKSYDTIVIHNAIQYVKLEKLFSLATRVNAKCIIISGHGLGFYIAKLMTLKIKNVYHAIRVLLGMNEEYIYNKRSLYRTARRYEFSGNYYETGNHPLNRSLKTYLYMDYYYYAKFTR